MQLFQSWKDSLKFFIPSNLKLFGLLTLNTTIKTYSVWLRYFWPLFIVSIMADVFHLYYFNIGPVYTSVSSLIGLSAKFLLFITLYLSLRPSVKKKMWAYFLDYKIHALFICISFFIITFAFQIITGSGPYEADLFALLIFLPFFVATMTIFMLFYLDSRGRFSDLFLSFWRYLKMFFFGLPFFLVVSFIAYLIFFCVSLFLELLFILFVDTFFSTFSGRAVLLFSSVMRHILILSSVPAISMIANFYTKRLRDQFKLYFLS